MPRGFQGVRQVAENNKNAFNNASNEGNYVKKFKLLDGATATVRFLDQGEQIAWCHIHAIPTGGQWPEDLPCLDQDGEGRRCPGCESDNAKISKRKFKGFINLIWRNAPKQEKKGDKWETTSYEDQIAVWMSGITVFDELDTIDVNYKGLISRDFRIVRKGAKLDTTYSILPADVDSGPQPLSDADNELTKKKYDLQQFITPLSAEEMAQKMTGNSGGVAPASVNASSAFAGRGGAPDPARNIFTQ